MACKDMSEYTCSLSKESLEYAKLKLREDPVTRMLEVKAFRERLLQYGHGEVLQGLPRKCVMCCLYFAFNFSI